jgi:HSP20 family protein
VGINAWQFRLIFSGPANTIAHNLTQRDKNITMKLLIPVMLAVPAATAYCMNVGFTSRPPSGVGRIPTSMSVEEKAEFKRQSGEFVNKAFEQLANELNSSNRGQEMKKQENVLDPSVARKQQEMINKGFDFISGMGEVDEDDLQQLRAFANRGFGFANDVVSGSYSPAYEINDPETVLEISLDLPGVEKSNIDIQIEDNVLTVSGSREMGRAEPKSVPFSKSFPLDSNVDTDKMSAFLNSGVLLIRAPKKTITKAPSKRIPIL